MGKRYYELFYRIVLNKWFEKDKLKNLKNRVINSYEYNKKSSINALLVFWKAIYNLG